MAVVVARALRVTHVRLTLLCLLGCSAAAPQIAFAHRLPPEVVAFLKIDSTDGARLRVAVRVPTAILLDAGLPRVETVLLDLRTIDGRLPAVAAEVARSLDVTDGGQPLVPGSARWIVSVFGDRSFESFESATSHIAAPPLPVDRAVYWNEAFVDVQFDYALTTATPRIEARLNGLRMGGDFFHTRATFVPAVGASRTVTVSGPPQRVLFEPTRVQAASAILQRGRDVLPNERMLWLFVLCLAIPAARAWRPLAAFVLGHVALLLWVALRASPLTDVTVDLARFVLGGSVVLAAVQALLGSSLGATALTAVTAACAGVTSAIVLGHRAHEWVPLAGAYGGTALGALAILVVAIAVGALVLLRPLIRVPYQGNAPAWLVTAAWAAIPAHEASHEMIEAAERLASADPLQLRPAVQFVLAHGTILALILFVSLVTIAAWTARRSPQRSGWPASV